MNKTDTLFKNDISWQKTVLKYAHPDLQKSIWQILNSFVPYVLLLFLMYRSLEYPYWVTILLAIPDQRIFNTAFYYFP